MDLTEASASVAGHDARTSIIRLDQVPRALATRGTRGLIKLVADSRTDVLLGGRSKLAALGSNTNVARLSCCAG